MEARPYLSAAMVIAAFGIVGALMAAPGLNRTTPARSFGDGPPPADIDAAVLEILAEDRCLPAEEAETAIRSRLDALGHSSWTIGRGAGVKDGGCVTLSIEPVEHRIVLLMALDPKVRKGLEALADDLLRECKTKDEASELVRGVLSGTEGWELRTDGGLAGPNEVTVEEVRQHVDAGCWIYSGTGWTAEGVRIYRIGGK
jgi:hypothetical protein